MAIELNAFLYDRSLSADAVLVTLINFLCVFIRILSFVMFSPILGAKLVLGKIKIVFSVLVSFLLFQGLQLNPNVEVLNVFSLILLIVSEFLVGIAMAFVVQLLFQTITAGAEIISAQTGFSFAMLFDPSVETSVPVIGQFYLLMTTLIFLKMDAHLELISILKQSFVFLDLNHNFHNINWQDLVSMLGILLGLALKIALPLLTLLLIVNIAFGLMTKISPQLNVFTLGLPLTLLISLLFILMDIQDFKIQVDGIWQRTRELLELEFVHGR
ncbi:MAG: flagellar biosynthetic protein FliR [Gammaproteobacteria bacterium]